MKHKIYIFISSQELYLSGDERLAFTASTDEKYGALSGLLNWPCVGECEIEITEDQIAEMKSSCVAKLVSEVTEIKSEAEDKLAKIETRKDALIKPAEVPNE